MTEITMGISLREGESKAYEVNAIFVNGFIPTNPFFASRETGLDGKMFITNQRFVFKSKKHIVFKDLFKQEFTVEFKDVVKVEKQNLFIFFPFFVIFTLSDGSNLKFSFGFSREKPLKIIKEHIN
jgi:hypothetical protein